MFGNTASNKLFLSLNIVICGLDEIRNANFIDYSRTFYFGNSLLTSPHSYAYLPLIYLPVRIKSLALFNPTIGLSRIVPPSIKGTPTLLQNTPNIDS